MLWFPKDIIFEKTFISHVQISPHEMACNAFKLFVMLLSKLDEFFNHYLDKLT